MTDGLRAITLHQPWATLVALGVKSIETRSWSTRYRGPLAIHAGATRPARGEHGERFEVVDALGGTRVLWDRSTATFHSLPLGAVVATCTLADVVPMVGRYDPGPNGGGAWVDLGTRLAVFGLGDGGARAFDVEDQRPYGDFAPGRFAWLLEDVTPCAPIPAKGRQRLWTWAP